MATQDPYSEGVALTVGPPTGTTVACDRGMLERCRERSSERKQARLISARNRRMLGKWLRRTAEHVQPSHPLTRRRETLLHHRAAAVRADLLEIAALLERAHNPDPACIAELHQVLANGCDSPLYNADIHISELHATLHHVRARLTTSAERNHALEDTTPGGSTGRRPRHDTERRLSPRTRTSVPSRPSA